ncbi:hypothetical protein BN1080_00125 [Planococcus massiliensis]|uniref:N-acetyltransferase domain-containing protein n=1 Tax=Planococcus massiliensis TaxID=1499687 RepID=A0A098EIV0_9BACL|nr:GNAT family N-acetyltransferase [Planococcus massiliensis]CEG21221.1 hypothetical protein BN1080_00125 [Planococcus massiliensis]
MEFTKAAEMKHAFIQMFNLYAHELSAHNPWIGTQIDREGNYLSEAVSQLLTGVSQEAFCIIEDGRPIGMAVFSSSEKECSIDEIFLVQTSRGKGISERICTEFWNKHTGICTLHVLKRNDAAVKYWEKLIPRCGYRYKKREENEQMWRYEVELESGR